MKEIKLTQGKVAIVDDEDYDELNKLKWYTNHNYNDKYYAVHSINKTQKKLKLHRVIMNVTNPKIVVDHINGDGLDNRKCNLRICSHKENMMNRVKQNDTTSKYKGVWWDKDMKRWRAYIGNKKLGSFKLEVDAAKAYNEKAKELFGDFAKINIIL